MWGAHEEGVVSWAIPLLWFLSVVAGMSYLMGTATACRAFRAHPIWSGLLFGVAWFGALSTCVLVLAYFVSRNLATVVVFEVVALALAAMVGIVVASLPKPL
jgi:hypothetical protein